MYGLSEPREYLECDDRTPARSIYYPDTSTMNRDKWVDVPYGAEWFSVIMEYEGSGVAGLSAEIYVDFGDGRAAAVQGEESDMRWPWVNTGGALTIHLWGAVPPGSRRIRLDNPPNSSGPEATAYWWFWR